MDIRTIVLGLGVFCATFLVGWWLNIGTVFYGSGAPQARPAAEVAATSGQGQSEDQSTQRFVAHVPVSTGAQDAAAAPKAQPSAPQARLPQVKYAQEPKAKGASTKAANASSPKSSSPKPGIRRR